MNDLYESFRWLRDDLKPSGPLGNKFQVKGVALYPTISGNLRKYVDEELHASARTLVGKPVTVNHDFNRTVGNVIWAEYEDGKIEYVMEIDGKKASEYVQKLRDKFHMGKTEYVNKWGRDPIYGVSVEANYRFHDLKCAGGRCDVAEPRGIIFNALSLVEDPEKPGVQGTTIELWEKLGVREGSMNEAHVIDTMLHDYVEHHQLPAGLAETYKQVVGKFTGKNMNKTKEAEMTPEMKRCMQQHMDKGESEDMARQKCMDMANEAIKEWWWGYDSFEACVAANSDKGDPEAYCASGHGKGGGEMAKEEIKQLKREAEVKALQEKHEHEDMKDKLQATAKAIADLKKFGETLHKELKIVHAEIAPLTEKLEKQCGNYTEVKTGITSLTEIADKHQKALEEINTQIVTFAKSIDLKTLGESLQAFAKTDDLKLLKEAMPTFAKADETNMKLATMEAKQTAQEQKYGVLNQAWETLKKEHGDYVSATEAKLTALKEEKERSAKETQDKSKELEEKVQKSTELAETALAHSKPNFKVKGNPEKTPQEPVYAPAY